MPQGLPAAGDEMAAKRHILQKPAIRALQQVAIMGKEPKGAGLGL